MRRYFAEKPKSIFPTAALNKKWSYKFHLNNQRFHGPVFNTMKDAWEAYKKEYLKALKEYWDVEDRRIEELYQPLGRGPD